MLAVDWVPRLAPGKDAAGAAMGRVAWWNHGVIACILHGCDSLDLRCGVTS